MSLEAGLFIAFLMLLGNAFFVGAEFGLVAARRSNIELLALDGSRQAKITLGAMERVALMLAGAQLGVTLCSLILGAVGEPLIAHLLEDPLYALGVSEIWIHPISIFIALSIMVYLHVVIGEMVPKNLALAGPTKAALWLTPPLVIFVKITRPIVQLLNSVANGCLRLFGIKPKQEITSSFSRDEVAGFVKESHTEGLLSSDEEQLLSGALSFDERNVKSVLLTFDTLVIADFKSTAKDIERLCTETGFSRFPIKNSRGEMKGYVHIKDIIDIADIDHQDPLPRRYIRPLVEVKSKTSLREALIIMQRSGAHLAQVKNTRGMIIGVITLEDLLEELVGSIRDDTRN